MRIVVLSPRVAPGLLTLAAWDVLRDASTVFATERDAHVTAIETAGIPVTIATERPTSGSADVWLAPTGNQQWAQELATSLVAGSDDEIDILFGSYDVAGSRLIDVVDVMDRLRRECPWTSQQTHQSLREYVLEEAHEVAEAIDSGDSEHLREELGDLFMQVVFHAAIAAESEGWDVDDVAAGIAEKLIYRSPHVFADGTASTAEEVDAEWQRLKSEKR